MLSSEASFEASPIVVDGVMYVSTGLDDVYALNAATGTELWGYHPEKVMPKLTKLSICCADDDRGVAYAGGTIEIRGFVPAYSQRTGALDWRFYTTEPGTWAGDSWRTGGAPVWGNPSVDPSLGLLYVTTGNPSPDLNGKLRAGENLYSDSILALDLSTGRLRWYFQEVHHDLWDYDGPQPVVLFDVRRNGQTIPALGHCTKSGQYYIIDRRTGQPVFPVTERPEPAGPAWQHAWPVQPISSVQPLTPQSVSYTPPGLISAPEFTPPTPKPRLIEPGADGGCEWEPPAYSPRTGDVYYEARYLPALETANPAKSGLLVAGDLVFYGDDDGTFTAADASTGTPLWSFQATQYGTVGGPAAGLVAYTTGGHEYVASPFGGNSADAAFQESLNGDALVAFALPGPHYAGPHITYSDMAFSLGG